MRIALCRAGPILRAAHDRFETGHFGDLPGSRRTGHAKVESTRWARTGYVRRQEFDEYIEIAGRYAPEGRWLDVGCRAGFFLSLALARGIDAPDADPAAAALTPRCGTSPQPSVRPCTVPKSASQRCSWRRWPSGSGSDHYRRPGPARATTSGSSPTSPAAVDPDGCRAPAATSTMIAAAAMTKL
jgi:hypothetical protein